MPHQAPSISKLGDALAAALEAYHQQTAGPRFRILTSRLAFHIVPDQVHSAPSGSFERAKNPLDFYILVPSEERTPAEHVLAINAAITAATGVPLRYGMLNADAFNEQFEDEVSRFTWGATGLIARDVLLDLLDRSATTFSWELLCQAAVQPKDHFAVFR
jgi:hypothetical protein